VPAGPPSGMVEFGAFGTLRSDFEKQPKSQH